MTAPMVSAVCELKEGPVHAAADADLTVNVLDSNAVEQIFAMMQRTEAGELLASEKQEYIEGMVFRNFQFSCAALKSLG